MAAERRLIALSWMMPPLVFPRAIQISRTLKVLRGRGWNPEVVTAAPDATPNETQDHRFAAAYDGVYVRHVVELREAVQRSPLRVIVRRWRRPPVDIVEENWDIRATAALSSLLRSRRYDALVTFAQPWIDHKIGLAVHRRFPELPWVAHFSDPWVDSPYIANHPDPERVAAWREQERSVVGEADSLVFVTQQTADLVLAKYPDVLRSKVFIVPHGYDSDLSAGLNPRARPGTKLRFLHMGNLYAMREPDALLRALAELAGARRQADLTVDFEIDFIGYVSPSFVRAATELQLDEIVRFHGPKSYLDCLQAATEADIFVSIDAPSELSVFLPSKIVDYLMFRKPILGLTPLHGAAADVLRRAGQPIAEPNDSIGIAARLRELLDQWRAGALALTFKPQEFEQFDIRRTTLFFEQALDAAINRWRQK